MADLEIPQAAIDALAEAVEGGARGDTAPDVRRIAAPVVVAALRAFADELQQVCPAYTRSDLRRGFDNGLDRASKMAASAADDLDREQRLNRFIGSVEAGPDFASGSDASGGEVSPNA